MRLGISVPERHVRKDVLDAALEATTRLDLSMLESGAPTFDQAGHRIQWKPEPPGDERFDHVGKILPRGWADCDDLSSWHAASLRFTGEDPGARAEVYKSGPRRWHAIVKRSDGSIDDPSEWCGMLNYKGPAGVLGVSGGAVLRPLRAANVGAYTIAPQLAVRPRRDGMWEARADLPWDFIPWNRKPAGTNALDVAMAALHTAPVASQAIAGACKGAAKLAAELETDPDWCADYLEAVAWAHDGAEFEEIAEEFGDEIAEAVADSVGNLWRSIAVGAFKPFKAIAKAASPILKPVRKVVDSKAFTAAAPMFGGSSYLLAKGLRGLDKSSGGSLLDMAKGAGAGYFRGGADYLDHPLVKAGAGAMGMKKMTDQARGFSDMAARALEDTPPMAAEQGVPVATPESGGGYTLRSNGGGGGGGGAVARLSPGGGIREIIIRA